MIEIRNVSKRFGKGKTLFKDLTFQLKRGDFLTITGPSGAGKTSLLQMIYGFLPPNEGKVTVDQNDVYAMNPMDRALLRRQMGFIFQDFRLIPHFTVAQNVGLPLELQSVKPDRVQIEVEKILARVGILENADDYPEMLSGGAQQKVAVARAMIHKPQWLFADEPTGNLDPGSSQEIFGLFQELHREGTSVVLATHDENLVRNRLGPCLRLEQGGIRGVFA